MKEWLPIIQLHLHKILLLVMLFALHSICWRQSFHFTSVSHQALISKGHFQRDSHPFIISSWFHIMPDLFTNTNILPLFRNNNKHLISSNTGIHQSNTFQNFKLSLGNRESPIHIVTRLPGHVNLRTVAKNKAATIEKKFLFDPKFHTVINQ